MAAIESWQAQADNAERAAKHRSGMRGRVMRRGLFPTRPPAGYEAVRDDMGKIARYELTGYAATVSEMTRLFLEGRNYSQVTRALNQAGYRTVTGRTFNQMRVWEILNHDAYAGYVSWGVYRSPDPSPLVPALWDEMTYARVCRRRAELRGGPVTRGSREPLLAGVCFCNRCGEYMLLHDSANRKAAMVCSTHHYRYRTESGGCHRNAVPVRFIVARLAEYLAASVSQSDLDARQAAMAENPRRTEIDHELARLTTRLADLHGQRGRVATAYATGTMPIDLYAGQLERIKTEAAQAEQQRRVLEAERETIPDGAERLAALRSVANLAAAFKASYADRTLDQAAVAQALRAAGIRVWCEDGFVVRIEP